MKCKFCGTKIKKSDEICPECGKYSGEQKTTADMGKCLKKFSCNDKLPLFIFCLLISIAVIAITAKKIYIFETIDIKSVLLSVASGIFLFPLTLYLCLITCKSYICVCEKGIYGAIPWSKKFMPQKFKFYYDDIKSVKNVVDYRGKGAYLCTITILRKNGEENKITCLNKKNSKLFTDMAHQRLDKQD